MKYEGKQWRKRAKKSAQREEEERDKLPRQQEDPADYDYEEASDMMGAFYDEFWKS